MPNKEEIGKIAAFLETNREKIVEKWIEKKSVVSILRKYEIPTHFFVQRFAEGVVSYFVEILRYEKPVGHCPSMNRFVDLMYDRNVRIHEIFLLCVGLRYALLHVLDTFGESVAHRKILSEMLSEIFNKNLAGVLEYFEKRLLGERIETEAAERRLGLHIRRLQTILDLQENAIFKFDRDSVYLANRSFYRLVGTENREAFGTKYPDIWNFVESADDYGELFSEGRYDEWIGRLVDERGGECDISLFDHARHRNVTMHMKIKEMPGSRNREYVVVLQDITAQKEALESLNHMVYTDALTQVPNRRRFDEVLAEALDACEKREKPFYLLIVDIHNLVEINERFGRDTGDEILKSFAGKVNEKLVGRAFFGRIDGDRFGIVARNLSLQGAREYAKEVLSILRSLHIGGNASVRGNVAVVSCQKGDDASTMLERASILIAGIKEKGGNDFTDDTGLLEERRHTRELVAGFLHRCRVYEKEGKTVEVVNFYQEVPIQSQGKIVKVTD
ncbi:diguanylate cyclase domain-containing protein, partial [Hydrogenimonas sp.]